MKAMELDLHTHSISSGHYTTDTATDMIKEAGERGLQLLGISEHGPAIPYSCTASFFRGLSLAPRQRMGIRILYGAEVNIIRSDRSRTGTDAKEQEICLDLPDEVLKKLDYCIAGMHKPCIRPGTAAENTEAYIRAMQNPYVRIIAHPDDTSYPVDYVRFMEAAADYHVVPEINNSSLSPGGYRGEAEEVKKNDRAILSLCRKYHYPVILSSDSHGHSDIGNFRYALMLIRETDFPEELILNTSVRKFMDFMEKDS